ncbi:MAG: quinol:electron acceptor oxidoreductase subunit ActD [Vicinamibacterales bacterium]
MKAVYALFTDPDAAQRAVDELRTLGVAERDIVVMSSEPFEEYEFSHRDKATWLHWIAGGGGLLGMIAGYLLTTTTQQLWPLVTSGMPIVSTWPNTIIVFEMTMLGAILATVTALLVTASLPSRLSQLYDPAVTQGYILVGVEAPPDDLAARLDRALASVEGGQVKSIA